MKIAHISDIHFGADLEAMVPILLSCLQEARPDLVVISGDFTQNGTRDEFIRAHDFLNNLKLPYFCVPGNHDVPRLNMLKRFVNPYSRYRSYIMRDLNPVFENESVVIAGFNTARRMLPHWNWANGAVSDAQLSALRRIFSDCGDRKRICVFHHPLHKAAESPLKVKVFGARPALAVLEELKIDIVLTGHVHHASIDRVGSMAFVSASTAISRRTRMQSNGFNMIELKDGVFDISHYIYADQNFIRSGTVRQAGT